MMRTNLDIHSNLYNAAPLRDQAIYTMISLMLNKPVLVMTSIDLNFASHRFDSAKILIPTKTALLVLVLAIFPLLMVHCQSYIHVSQNVNKAY